MNTEPELGKHSATITTAESVDTKSGTPIDPSDSLADEAATVALDSQWRHLSSDQLELQCQPSHWSRRVPAAAAVPLFVQHCRTDSARARASLGHRLAVYCARYAGDEHDRTDSDCVAQRAHAQNYTMDTDCDGVYTGNSCCCQLPSAAAQLYSAAPLWDEYGPVEHNATGQLVVFVHGGYWQEMSSGLAAAPALNFTTATGRPAACGAEATSAAPPPPAATPSAAVAIPPSPAAAAAAGLNRPLPCLCVSYPLAPAATLCQIERHVRHVTRHLAALAVRTHCRRLLLIGHSAGAQLITCMLDEWQHWLHRHCPLAPQTPPPLPPPPPPSAAAAASTVNHQPAAAVTLSAIYLSGVFNLQPLVGTTVNRPLQLTLQSARHHSAIYRTDHQLAALINTCRSHLVLVGEHDSAEFRRQSRHFAQLLLLQSRSMLANESCDVRVRCRVMRDHDHFSICEALSVCNSDVTKELEDFLMETTVAGGK